LLARSPGDPVHVTTAQLPDATHSADRVFLTDDAVIVLDGATAFIATAVDPRIYVDALGHELISLLAGDPSADLRAVLAAAISTTANALNLRPGNAPSSTVAILRSLGSSLDLLVLGDSSIILGGDPCVVITDDRLEAIGLPVRQAYRTRLAAGHGYDDEHRRLVAALQARQRRARNIDSGYWIAEADPAAAKHAYTRSTSWAATPWAILATDGVSAHCTPRQWPHIAELEQRQLSRLLRSWREWEATTDPDGQLVPRAKPHDDMALAIVHPAKHS